jgi:FtsH-binding integral membrane protein
MTINQTLILAAVLFVSAVFCGWRGARAPDFRRGARLIPWRPLMVLCAALLLVTLFWLMRLMRYGPGGGF